MCTVVILRRPDHDWPILIAGNRDEMADRPWTPPARHWEDRPEVVAGQDTLAGGTWLGVNDWGVFATVLNRMNTLGPQEGFRSRGELPLEALEHAEALAAKDALLDLSPAAYRPFNMVIADFKDAFWLHNDGAFITAEPIPEGLSMLTAHDMNDFEKSPRQKLHYPRIVAAPTPDPASGDWMGWEAMLSSRLMDDNTPGSAMQVETDTGFGTTSSSLIALPKPQSPKVPPLWRFAAGRPSDTPFETVSMGD